MKTMQDFKNGESTKQYSLLKAELNKYGPRDLGELKETDTFDYYVPDDPKEYKIAFIDHIGLIDTEIGKLINHGKN